MFGLDKQLRYLKRVFIIIIITIMIIIVVVIITPVN